MSYIKFEVYYVTPSLEMRLLGIECGHDLGEPAFQSETPKCLGTSLNLTLNLRRDHTDESFY